MSALELHRGGPRERFGLKGPGAAQWLAEHGLGAPSAPNTWIEVAAPDEPDAAVLVARLGACEFFLEDRAAGTLLRSIEPAARGASCRACIRCCARTRRSLLSGAAVHEVLAQVCNVNFADPGVESRPVIMTLMIGVSVLVVPRVVGGARRYRIWCDPTYGPIWASPSGRWSRSAAVISRGVSA